MAESVFGKKNIHASFRLGVLLVGASFILSSCMTLTSDKALHFSATGAISALVACVVDEEYALVAGASAGMGAGIAKEVYDEFPGGSGLSMEDIFVDAVGTGVGTFVGYALCHPAPAPKKPELIEYEETNDILLQAMKLE